MTREDEPASLRDDEVIEEESVAWPRRERRGRADDAEVEAEAEGIFVGDALAASAAAADGAVDGENAPMRGRRILSVGVASGFGSAAEDAWPLTVGGVTGLWLRAEPKAPFVFARDETLGVGGGR